MPITISHISCDWSPGLIGCCAYMFDAHFCDSCRCILITSETLYRLNFRSIRLSTRASLLVLAFCWKSKVPRVFSGAGYPPYLDTVLREPASSVSMNSSRSITQTLLVLSMPPSTRPWFTLRDLLRLKSLQMLPSVQWRLWRSVCKHSLDLQEACLMASPSLWKLKAMLGELKRLGSTYVPMSSLF